jgi:integrase
VWRIISQRCDEAKDGWLFHEFYAGGYDGKRGHKVSPNFTKFRRAVLGTTKEDDLAAARAGEPKVNFHSFRHTWATYCDKASTKTLAANASVRDQLFGHKKAALALNTYSEGLGLEEIRACMKAVEDEMEDGVVEALKVPFGD